MLARSDIKQSFYLRAVSWASFILLVFFLSTACYAQAETPSDTKPLELDELIAIMRANNPQIKQAQQNYIAARAVVPQVLAFNNPLVGLIENPIPGSPVNLGKSTGFSYTITQSFPFPGKKGLAGDIAEYQADFTKTQIDSLYLQLLMQLKANFYQMLVLKRQSEINRENIQRLEQIKQTAKVRYANNAAAFVDFLNAQVAQSSAENDQFALQRQIDTVRQTLNTVIGRDPSTPLEIKGALPDQKAPKRPVSELEELALRNNPSVKASGFQVNAANKGVDLARKQYLPDFQVILTGISGNPPWGIGGHDYGVEFDVVLPTWFFTKEKAGVEQANASLLSSRFNDLSLRQQVRLSVDTAFNALVQAVNQSNFIKTRQMEEAKAAYRLALTNYSTGVMAFSDLLTAQSNLRNTELAFIQSENNAILSYINLVTAVGTDVD